MMRYKKFRNLTISLNIYNYFDSPIRLISNLYLAKFLDTSANSFRVRFFDRTFFIILKTMGIKKRI